MLKNEIKALILQKDILNQCGTKDIPKTPMTSPNTRLIKALKTIGPSHKSYA